MVGAYLQTNRSHTAIVDPAWSARRFAVWWLRSKPFNIPAHNETARYIGPVLGVTVYRSAPFQVDFLIGPPHTTVPPHSHPNVDSLECWIAGNETTQGWTESHSTRQGMTEIPAGEQHAATFGDCAVSWFSIQKWVNGREPGRIELDWHGPPMDRAHYNKLW